MWVNGQDLGYSNWEKGQPNNAEKVEHYVVLRTDRSGMWWDFPNEPKKYPPLTRGATVGFVCQWK